MLQGQPHRWQYQPTGQPAPRQPRGPMMASAATGVSSQSPQMAKGCLCRAQTADFHAQTCRFSAPINPSFTGPRVSSGAVGRISHDRRDSHCRWKGQHHATFDQTCGHPWPVSPAISLWCRRAFDRRDDGLWYRRLAVSGGQRHGSGPVRPAIPIAIKLGRLIDFPPLARGLIRQEAGKRRHKSGQFQRSLPR